MELVQEIYQILIDKEETCHRTCFSLQLDGTTLDNFAELKNVEGLKEGSVLRVVEGLCYQFCSLALSDPRVGPTMDILFPFVSVIPIDSSAGCPVHVLMLSIQAVRGLPRLRTPGIVPSIISFSRQLPHFLMV